eukprot:s540_g4.t1
MATLPVHPGHIWAACDGSHVHGSLESAGLEWPELLRHQHREALGNGAPVGGSLPRRARCEVHEYQLRTLDKVLRDVSQIQKLLSGCAQAKCNLQPLLHAAATKALQHLHAVQLGVEGQCGERSCRAEQADVRFNKAVLDVFIVLSSLWEVIIDIIYIWEDQENKQGFFGMTGLKAFRIVRITRLFKAVRLMRIFRFVRALRTLITSILHTLKSLFWAVVLLGLIVYVFSVLFTQIVNDELLEGNWSVEQKLAVLAPLEDVSHLWAMTFVFYIFTWAVGRVSG